MSQRKAQNDYQKIIRSLSDRIVEAQTPIRVLDAIKWDDGIRQDFLKGRGKHAPKVDRGYYDSRPLAFDASAKKQEFQNIERDITRQLGQFNPVGQIMRRMCKEYRMVIRMLEARGTPDLGLISQELYGSASDAFHAGDPTLADLGLMLSDYLNNIADRGDLKDEPKTLTAKEVVPILQARLNTVFGEEEGTIRVFESDGIVADAAAGADYIKVRADALFNERDVRALEVHEGLVHVGTTLNGLSQPICTFLAKGPPSSTVTQEGLAILMEVIAFASYPTRLRKLTNRTRAIHMAEEGADFLDVFHFYREQGYSLEDSYQNASRVFRGSTPDGLPFTKDLSYLKGFILIYNYIQLAVRKGKLEQIPPAVLRQDHPGRHAHPAPTGGRGPGGAAEVPAAAVPRPQRAVGLDVLLELPQPPQPGPHRSGLREHPLTVPRRAGLSRCARAVGRQARRTAMASHELDYRILGESMQTVEIELDPGETVIAEAGAMNYMTGDIRFTARMGDGSDGSLLGKLWSAGKRKLGGESVFMTHFTNEGQGKQHVAFAAPYPGSVVAVDLDDVGGRLFCQKDSFLCAAYGTRVGIAFTKRLGAGFFGGEGFILQKLEGDGLVFVHAGGTLIRRQLNGETLRVDTGCLVAFTDGIDYDVQLAGGLKSMLFGGEGLLLTTLKGSGTVWLQSLPFSRLAGRIYDATFRARDEVRTNNG